VILKESPLWRTLSRRQIVPGMLAIAQHKLQHSERRDQTECSLKLSIWLGICQSRWMGIGCPGGLRSLLALEIVAIS